MKTLAFLLLTSFSLHAAAQDYVLAEDRLSSGSLTLNGKQFSVETISRNGNVCEYEGTIKNRVSKDRDGCIVHFFFADNSVKLTIPDSAREACQEYCGHNATFDATYYKMPAACSAKGTAAMEKRFQTTYQGKRYREAAAIKQRYLNECDKFLYLTDWMRTLNDLSVSYKNAGDKAACRKALAPMDEWLKDYRPSYLNEEAYKREAAAAQFNLKQCSDE
ncbi:hypothetical protein [Neisseria sicca]|jgi:hypothetical protein|uniref:hypothetical protein n=1 Tax=Neisseria sicca TaxID=490 RepID=UPI000D2FE6A7|nr:hypothetical protein [Neisseria sicca]MBF1286964.1 hypothetical protein [Neisseria sp.]